MSRIDLDSRQMLFVLGVERSGSTWLANLLDSSPETLLFMEPFTEVADLFRGFPDRLTYLASSSPFLTDDLRETVADLPTDKFFGLEEHGSPGWLRRLNWTGQKMIRRVSRRLGSDWNRRRLRYRELNLNRPGNPEVFEFDKRPEPGYVAIKELRLNFKVRMLAEVFPEARVLVIIRNPLSQVVSILRLVGQDRLVNLRRFLGVLYESLDDHGRFAKFADTLDGLPDDDLLGRAVAYWFINYSTLVEDLRASGLDHRIVRHEQLCDAPMAETEDVFAFAGLEPTDQTREYVRSSSQTPGGSSEPTATTRESADYYRRTLQQVDDDIRDRFRQYAKDFWPLAPDVVGGYRDWLRNHLSSG